MYKVNIQEILYKFYEKISKRDVTSKYKKIYENQWNDDKLINQEKMLKEILLTAKENVPYYRQKLSNIDISSRDALEVLNDIPILTKVDIQNNYEQLINKKYKGNTTKNSSGGSTGIPVFVLQGQERNDFNSAATKLSDSWAGWNFNKSCIQFWGAKKDFKSSIKRKIQELINKHTIINTFEWTDDTIKKTNKFINEKKPNIIISYASALNLYVEESKRLGLKQDHIPDGIITSADMLYDEQRLNIESFFKCKIFNRYGCREVGLIASECEMHNGMHISMDRLIVEVVDENGKSVKNGDLGRIIVTDLTNYAMPIIRYEIGDIGCLDTESKCKCGRTSARIMRLEGRKTDYIITPSGRKINGAAVSTVITNFKSIKQIQFIQSTYSKVYINIVKKDDYDKDEENNIIEQMRNLTNNEIEFIVNYYSNLNNKNSGKLRMIVNNIE